MQGATAIRVRLSPCRFALTFAFPVGTMPFISSTTGVLRVGHRSARLMHHHPLEQAKSSLFFCLQVTFLQNYNLAIQPDHVKNAQDLVQFSFARTCLGIIQRWTSCFSANKVLRTGPRGPGWRGTLKRVKCGLQCRFRPLFLSRASIIRW